MLIVLFLLDLSPLFVMVDHHVLLGRLKSTFGLTGLVVNWFESNLGLITGAMSVLEARDADQLGVQHRM